MAPLEARGLLTPQPFDEPIDFIDFDTWHFYGRTAKFGVWMQGPDYTQWHGAYEILLHLAELRKEAKDKLDEAGGRR
jgi:hydroxylamine dehydrogenase